MCGENVQTLCNIVDSATQKKCRETVSLKKKKRGVKFNHVSSLTSLFYVNLNDLWALERLFNRESNRKVFTWLIAELPEKQRLQKSPLIVVTSLSDERAVKRYQSLLWTELIFFFFAETPTINWLTCHQIFFFSLFDPVLFEKLMTFSRYSVCGRAALQVSREAE